MKKNRAIAVVVVMALFLGLLTFTAAIGFGPTGTGSAKNIITGLDLAGGVSITYTTVGDETPSAEDMSDTIYKLQQRVQQYSTEAQVYQEGDNRINIEIPGVSDANKILEELGKPGSLEFTLADGTEVLTGMDVESAEAAVSQDNMKNREYVVELVLTSEGASKFATATSENIGNQISIVYDGNIISAPRVESAITGGRAQITGMADQEEAERLASSIRIGSLSLELEELRSNVVGAQLGEEAISTSLTAGAIGLAIVIVFMAIVYLIPGVAAGISLLIYTALMLVMLNAFDITLTLPGIAGIILSIGMAVDANVIIYARIREEIAAGKSVQGAIQTGFQKALSAIVDGNITTLIAALVLGMMGTGSVKGFAQTLAMGIVLSMFTALVISRLLVNAFYALGLKDEKYYGKQKERKTVNFLSKKNICFIVSLVLIIAGPVTMGVFSSSEGKALNYSLEFMGGTSTNVTFNEDMSIADIDSKVKPVVQGVTGDADIQTQKVSGTNQVIIKTRELTLDERQSLNEALKESFDVDESLITAESISSTVSNEMRSDAVVAVIVATICMLLYIWFRFKDVRFATSAVAALVHDVLVVLAFYAVSRISIGNTFIACMLTIVGYSINATIVIFDRIRENLKAMSKKTELSEVVNASITQTLTRSIYTSFTTFVMIAVLYVLGVPSIREFALPLIVGVVCGGYSSVCITGALWYVMKTKLGKKKA
ncbi:protein translocase subunit SecD [Hominisplanchenecus murintestinalis]|jgi:SecD/SecF fusion protein|uniref:Protein translocase subunit SecD n=1 Tax=Hominisplanchenecus murintestinalis TaxID=2941517 RepID=A0AC61QZ59_9FIRM|nr:protein translocase subunit SecD [Hominisplanchenecus murintestinalis]NBH97744.1 protein translocase subunit SecD [Lachnospiraceae bacterium]NBI74800.1 protein translocase subunit SecD [Lachnospiraceae bacterium]RKJ95742.1 protein translocase subunit SecD [Anaerotruncus sp. 1XD22-93]TGX98297.1 protein translocase subunit SecD [Hominisplanchenecus murintestinalis]